MERRRRSRTATGRRLPPFLLAGVPGAHVDSTLRLLHRAGVACDVLTTNPRLRPAGPVRRTLRAGVDVDDDWMIAALRWREGHGGRVVLTDDWMLRAVRDSALSADDQARLLAVTSPEHLGHVGSKAGLAGALGAAGVPQPGFRVAAGVADLPAACAAVGFPLLVKVDRSGGGDGVVACRSAAEMASLVDHLPAGPLLVQEWIDGTVVDLSGFFADGRPVHFGHAEFLATVGGPFTPSKVRRYTHPSVFGRGLLDAVATLAAALGLDGFANVSAMRRSSDGALLVIEADLRPNVWVEMTRHMGDDPAPAIRAWLERGEAMRWPRPPDGRTTMEIGYLLRLRAWQAWTNRHRAWCQFADHRPRSVLRLLSGRAGRWAGAFARRCLPERAGPG